MYTGETWCYPWYSFIIVWGFSLNLGVEKLVGVYRERPNFADQDAQEDAKQRLCQVSQYRLYVRCIQLI